MSRRMRWVGHVARMGEKRNAYRILVGKPEGRRPPLGRTRRRWVDNIKIDLKRDGMGWCGLGQSGSGQGPLEGSCEHDDEPSSSIKRWGVLEWLHNWRFSQEGLSSVSKKLDMQHA
jgi:hypothetical protein